MRPVTYSWLVVVVAVACAAIGWLGVAGWLAVVVAAATVGMHVAGNAIGTRLREATDSDLRRHRAAVEQQAIPAASPSLLERRSDLTRLVRISAGIGAVCGGLAGTAALRLVADSSPAGAVLGGLSSAVIGAIIGFLGASFVEIVRTSLREAIAAERGR
jgi:hypothetical protein